MRTDPVQQNVVLYRVAVAVVLLSIVGVPALSAAPTSIDAPRLAAVSGPVAWFGQWLDGLTTGLESVWQRNGCHIDPNGGTCTEGATAPETSAPETETWDGLPSTDVHDR